MRNRTKSLDFPENGQAADRRVSRSKRALRTALVSLLRERDYDDFTVADLLTVADVGRSTFYTHYSGKNDLLRQSLQMLHLEVRQAMLTAPPPAESAPHLAFSAILLEHVHEHRDLNRRLKGRGREIFLEEFTALVGDLIREELKGSTPAQTASTELTIQFIRGGFISMVMWWLERPGGQSPADIDATFQTLARRSIAEALTAAG